MERCVDISSLNRNISGKIDWVNNIGKSINFIYDDIKGTMNIIDTKLVKKNTYTYREIIVDINGSIYNLTISNILNCSLGRILGKIGNEIFLYSIGAIICDERRNLKIINRFIDKKIQNNGHTSNTKTYTYLCLNCGNIKNISESNIIKNKKEKTGCGCSVCNASIPETVLGINTIWDTDRWMCDLGVSEEDAKRYSRGSTVKIKIRCKICGNEKYMTPNTIYGRKSIQCTCGDGFSYPEKFMYSALKQLGVEFQTQYSPEWIGKKRYDFYIPSLNMIIETHGEQHYKEANGFTISLQSERKNDELKRELAMFNGIKYYVEINCKNSELNWIKENILNSKLNELFDLGVINWFICEEFALKNIMKDICDYWNNKEEWETVKDISSRFNICRSVVCKYLNKGCNLGMCNYNGREEYEKTLKLNHKNMKRRIMCLNDGNIFESITSASSYYGIRSIGSISAVCKGKRKTCGKGKMFIYLE